MTEETISQDGDEFANAHQLMEVIEEKIEEITLEKLLDKIDTLESNVPAAVFTAEP